MTKIIEKLKSLMTDNSQNKRKKKTAIVLVAVVLLLVLIGVGVKAGYIKIGKSTNEVEVETVKPKEVKTMQLGSGENAGIISTQGTVKAISQVDVLSQANGTVASINFTLGDQVALNQALINLSDDAAFTNYNNAGQNYANIKQGYLSTNQLTNESIGQAELGVKRAEEALAAAKILLETNQDNLNNTKEILAKNKIDQKNNAIVSFNNYLNTIKSSLDQIDYVIKADGDIQMPGIDATLGVKNPSQLGETRSAFIVVTSEYNALVKKVPSIDNVSDLYKSLNHALDGLRNLSDNTIIVLDNTIPNSSFSESSLSTVRNSMATLRLSVINAQSSAQSLAQSLQNIDLNAKQSLDNLENSIRAAENQLSQAQIGYENSILSLSNAKKSKDQQLILSQTTLDSARGQLNLINTQISDLTITAPIRGEITNKSVEIGTQVRMGQKVAQISQIDMVKIIIQLPFEDVAKLMLGETVRLNKNFEGKISYINPSADAISKKQEVEIIFDNKDRQLVPETFVSVEIPTKKIALEDKQVYYLPLKSVITAQNGNFIFIVKDGRAVKTAVELIGVEGEAALIKTDLGKDTPVAVEGNKMLEDGDEVVEITS